MKSTKTITHTHKRKTSKAHGISYEIHVEASHGIELAHCNYAPVFNSVEHREHLNPVDLVDDFNGVYDSHGIAIPVVGSVMRVTSSKGEDIEFSLDDSRIKNLFRETRMPTESKTKLFYGKAEWEDYEWNMSELQDSRILLNAPFEIEKVAIGVRIVPDMKGGTEELVSSIIYDGLVIHAVHGQTIGRGMECRFWTFQNGVWKELGKKKKKPQPSSGSLTGLFGEL